MKLKDTIRKHWGKSDDNSLNSIQNITDFLHQDGMPYTAQRTFFSRILGRDLGFEWEDYMLELDNTSAERDDRHRFSKRYST